MSRRGRLNRRLAALTSRSILLGALVLFAPAQAHAAPGTIDRSFGAGGLFVYPRTPTNSDVSTRQVVALSHGRLLALGGVGGGPLGGASWVSAASFALTDKGALDSAFGQGGTLVDPSSGARGYTTARELADGSLVLASRVLTCNSPSQCATSDRGPNYRVQRYRADGTLDTSYGSDGTNLTSSHLGNAAIAADGSAASLGATYSFVVLGQDNRPYAFDAVAVDAAGRANDPLEASFLTQMIRCSPGGTAQVSPYIAPVVQWTADERIIFAWGGCMLKLARDATPDAAFGSNGLSQVDNSGLPVTQVLVLKDGGTLTFSLLADGSSYRVVKRLASGAPDPAFGTAGVIVAMALPFTPIPALDRPVNTYTGVPNTRGFPAMDSAGRIIVAGYRIDSTTKVRTNYLARFDAKLALDTGFGDAGTGLASLATTAGTFTPVAMTQDASERIDVAGQLAMGDSGFGPYYAEAVMRLEADPVVIPVADSGGCMSTRDARVDPMLPTLLAFALVALGLRRRSK